MTTPLSNRIRLAARALIVINGKILLVNAYPGEGPNLWCAPGGGCEVGEAMTDTLVREVHEEVGLPIAPGAFAGLSEFHNARTGFHQVDLFFHATATGPLPQTWKDPEGVVHARRLVARDTLAGMPHKPDNMAAMAFDRIPADYHGLRQMVERSELGEI